MTAQSFTARANTPSTFSLDRNKRGSAPLGSAGATALGALTATSTVEEVLAILSSVTKEAYVVAPNQTGLATSVEY